MDSENVTTQMDDFKRQICAQTQQLYIIKTFHMSQMNPKKILRISTFSVQLPYINLTPK